MVKGTSRKLVAATLGLAIATTVTLAQAARVCAVLWQDANFSGPQFVVLNGEQWYNLGWFNDKLTSLKTYDGCVCSIFTDANFGGARWDFVFGDMTQANVGTGWNDQVSSVGCGP